MLIETLQKQTGLGRNQLLRLAETASYKYKVYTIPKRTGGQRVIAQPSKDLKLIQRWLNKFLFSRFPIHPNATAYKRGAKIKINAERHVQTRFTLRMDFQDFFPSFSAENIRSFFEVDRAQIGLELSPADIWFIAEITSRYGFLTIGAPSSPHLTNIMMHDFDFELSEFASAHNLIYTRYADDLFLSATEPNLLHAAEREVARLVGAYEIVSLELNTPKTAYLSKKYKRSITGLVITPKHELSIGRGKKREIKALVHQHIMGNLADHDAARLQGLLAFAYDCEPSFIEALGRKYSDRVITEIMKQSDLD